MVQQNLALDRRSDFVVCDFDRRAAVGRGQESIEGIDMGFISWIRKILSFDPSEYRPPKENKSSSMNEGDYRSGPQGYSPNTAYPDAFYGTQGDLESDGQNEGDFRR